MHGGFVAGCATTRSSCSATSPSSPTRSTSSAPDGRKAAAEARLARRRRRRGRAGCAAPGHHPSRGRRSPRDGVGGHSPYRWVMRRALAGFVALLIVVGCSGGADQARLGPAAGTDGRSDEGSGGVAAYRGLGTWVDVYDYVPAFQQEGEVPAVTPGRSPTWPGSASDALPAGGPGRPALARRHRRPDVLATVRRAGHRAGVQVVAWYLPRFDDLAADLRRIQSLLDFEADGTALRRHRRSTSSGPSACPTPPPATTRSSSSRSRYAGAAGDRPLGAIVLEPVQLEVINQAYWPDFPWRELASLYDVWLPMSYWTNRNECSRVPRRVRATPTRTSAVCATTSATRRARAPDRRDRRHRRRRATTRASCAPPARPFDRLVGLRLRRHREQRLGPPQGLDRSRRGGASVSERSPRLRRSERPRGGYPAAAVSDDQRLNRTSGTSSA